MRVPIDVSKPARPLSGNDVMFLVSLAFIFLALAVTIVIRH